MFLGSKLGEVPLQKLGMVEIDQSAASSWGELGGV